LQRLCFGPDVAAANADRGENRDPDMATTPASKRQLTEEARLENGDFLHLGLPLTPGLYDASSIDY
jgi:hypothetical protein